MKSDAFRFAVEAEDPDALTEVLADDVVFRSPVVFRPYEGKSLVSIILTEGAMKVFDDFRYVEQLEDEDAAALVFSARVGDRDVDGLDLLRFDGDGKVRELIVMARPMSGLNALAEAMGRQFERLGITPPAGAPAPSPGE
jgi:SnoaL-like domain